MCEASDNEMIFTQADRREIHLHSLGLASRLIHAIPFAFVVHFVEKKESF